MIQVGKGIGQRSAESAVFEWVCETLEEGTELSRLAARGTVRLALKKSGLGTRSVTANQMLVVIQEVMPNELKRRGIEEAERLCRGMSDGLRSTELSARRSTVSRDVFDVFRRLGRP